MRRSLFAVAFVAPFVVAAPALRAQTATFADIAWGSATEAVRTALTAKGYEASAADSDGDVAFSGQIMGETARGYAFFAPGGKLVKIRVLLVTADEAALPVYKKALVALNAKYGDAAPSVHMFKAPYVEGDGKEQEAIKNGNALVAAIWKPRGVSMMVTKKLTVEIAYEPPEWNAEMTRRQSKKPSDL